MKGKLTEPIMVPMRPNTSPRRDAASMFDIEPSRTVLNLYTVATKEAQLQQNRERWLELAEMAVNEQDPDKFFKIIEEINELLAQKQDRLSKAEKPKEDS